MGTVTQVGTPTAVAKSTALSSGTASSASFTTPPAWSGTQPRTAGDFLIAIVSAGDSSSAAATAEASGTTGWAKEAEIILSGSLCAIWAKVATGSDAAPNFTSALSGTAGHGFLSVYLIELTGQDGTTPVPIAGSNDTNSAKTLTVTTSGSVGRTGSYAICGSQIQFGTSNTQSSVTGSGFSNVSTDGATAFGHSFADVEANPATGSAVADAMGTLTAFPTGWTGVSIVVQPSSATNATVTGLTSATADASPTGSVTVAVTGLVSNTTGAAPAGSVQTGISGVTSSVTSASPAGTVTGTAHLTGAVSGVTSASPAGTVKVAVTGVTASSTSTSPAGHSVVAVAGLTSAVTSGSPAGVVSAITPREIEALGGTTTDTNLYGGIATETNILGGIPVADFADAVATVTTVDGAATRVSPVYGGTATDANVLGGTVTDANLFGGTWMGFTMQAQNITVGEFNDELIDVSVTSGGSAFNLTGYTLKVYLKTASGIDDADPSTVVLSSTGGSPAITVVSAPAGTIQIRIAHADLTDATNIGFWRLDVIDGSGNQNTAVYGTVTVIPL